MRLRAVLLILVAAAALGVLAAGGFYLLSDPERVRRTAETSLSDALGQDVRLEGAIGLRFLPSPQAVIAAPAVVGASAGNVLARADRIDLLLSPLALLRGDDPITSITVVRPAIATPLASADLLRLAQGPGAGTIRIVDGALAVQLMPDAPVLTLSGLSLERYREATGTTRIELAGRDAADGRVLTLQGDFRRADPSGGVPADLQFSLGSEAAGLRAVWQGLVAQDRLFGQLQLSGSSALPAWLGRAAELAPAAPWRAEARLDASPASLDVPSFTGQIGAGAFEGSLELDHRAATGTARLDLRGLSLDRPPASLSQFGGYQVALRIAGHDLTVRGVAVPSLDVSGSLQPDGSLALDRVMATIGADGAGRLVDGRLVMSGQPSLTGRISLDLPTAEPVLRQLDALPGWLPPDSPGGLLAEGQLTWSGGSAVLDQAAVRIDQSNYRGRIARLGERVELQGTVDRLDLDAWWGGPSDLREILAALPDGMVELAIGRLSWAEAWIQDVRIEASRTSGRLMVAEASAGTADDLRLTLAGTIEPLARAMDVVIGLDAERPARIGTLLGLDLAWLSRLEEINGTATLRGPAERLDVTVEAASGARKVLLAGTFGSGSGVEATALRLHAEAPDLAALLRDLALLPLAGAALAGPVALDADLSRAADGHWHAATDLRAGPVRADGRLDLRLAADRPRLAGQIELAPLPGPAVPDLYDFLSTALAFAPGSPLRWPGNWPAEPLRFDWLFGAELDLTLRRPGSGPRKGIGNVQLADGRLAVERLDLDLPGGGRLQGDVTLDATGTVPQLDLSLALEELDAGAAGRLLGIARAPETLLAAEFDLRGGGTSVAAIVADLEGTMRLASGPGTIPVAAGSLDPPFAFSATQGAFAVTRGIARSSPPGFAIDLPDRTRRYLEAALDLPVWFLEATLLPEPDRPARRLLGPPGRLQFVEINPTDPASAPAEPDDRTLLPSEAQAPAPTP